jgi:pilus assembly protein CpaC
MIPPFKPVRTRNQTMFVHIQTAACVAALAAMAGWAAPAMHAHAQTAGERNYIKLNPTAIGGNQRISVGLNKSMVIDLPGDAHDILVANPDVADAITRTSRRIYIFAKQVGETNIFIFDASGRQLLSIDLVIERDIAGLEANLAKYIPGSDIRVEMVNDNVILTGTVPTPQASARAVDLARVFVTGGEATTNQFDTQTAGSGDTIYLGDEEERQVSQIVNLLQIDGEDQVNLKVTIAEIQRTVVKQLGIDLTAVGAAGSLTYALVGDNPFPLGKTTSHSRAGIGYTHGSNSIDTVIRALDQSGVMRTLAEPSLTAISGETARFRVGGEYQVSDGKDEDDDGSVTYNYRQVEYGVGLAFTPVVLSPGRISLKIKTEVSEPTTEGSYAIPRGKFGAATAPGIRRRLAETTVELPSGGTMVLAGLLKDDVRQTVSGFPGLSKIPVIGTLFRSREFQRYETELVILVTPYLVRPVARSAMARPDDNFNAPNDGAGIFLGRVNRIYGVVDGNLPPGRYNGQVGFIYK